MTKWIRQPYKSNLRPDMYSTKVRHGLKEALNRYADEEGINATDIIDTLLMKDKRLREYLNAVQKELHDKSNNQTNHPQDWRNA